MCLCAEEFYDDWRKSREKGSMSQAINHGEKVEHPHLVGHLQPQQRANEKERADTHGPFATKPVDCNANKKPACHAYTADA